MSAARPPQAGARVPARGFLDPVREAQRTFRAVLDALARPTGPVPLDARVATPAGLGPVAGAIVLALADADTPLWLDPAIADDAELLGWLAFHTGAPIVADPASAAFAVVADATALPALDAFDLGTDLAPHHSTTVIAVVPAGAPTRRLRADGPGFERPTTWDAPLPAGFLPAWQALGAGFPRGVDLLLAGAGEVTGLPRTTRLEEAD